MPRLISLNTMISRLISLKPHTKLGRWEHRQTDKQLEIKLTWANADHCGDQICGRPEQIKQNTDFIFKDHIHYVSKNNKIETVTTLEDIKIEAKPAFK